MNVNQLISEKLDLLRGAGVSSSRYEIKILIGHILGVEPKEVNPSAELNSSQVDLLTGMVQQRLLHKPIDKIVGRKGFYKYDFEVNEDVLSPREDTEILVEKAIQILKNIKTPKILEFGVGSGCIILSILSDIAGAAGWGIDISKKALAIAELNAQRLGITPARLTLWQKSWFDDDFALKASEFAPFDMIVSNPPYIPTGEIECLDEEVKSYDPYIALEGGEDGLRDYTQIIKLSENLLKENGYLLLEAGDSNQLAEIKKQAVSKGLVFVDILKDLSNNERCIILKK